MLRTLWIALFTAVLIAPATGAPSRDRGNSRVDHQVVNPTEAVTSEEQGESGSPQPQRHRRGTGTVVFRNLSSSLMDCYISHAGAGYVFVGRLAPGFRLTVRRVGVGENLLAATLAGSNTINWGPAAIFLRKNRTYTWTLVD